MVKREEYTTHRRGKTFPPLVLLIIFIIQLLISIKTGASQTMGTFHPNGYNTLGPTTYISGTLADLQSDNSTYMTFRSYSSGKDTSDFVDNDTSDVDASADKGIHGNFSAQQTGPDSIYDTLTEENTGVSSGNDTLWLYVNADNENETDWTRVGTNPYLNATDYPTNFVNVSGNGMRVGDFSFTDSGKSTEVITSIEVQLYAKQTSNKALEVFVWTGSSWTSVGSQALPTSFSWVNWTATTELDTWTKIDAAKIYLETGSSTGTYEVDCARFMVNYFVTDNYELDLEVTWLNADFNEPNEELCIYGGSMGAENIMVGVWNDTGWENLFTDLNSGWNNISVTSHLTSSDFTIRFTGSTETGDISQDSWTIDVLLIYVWSNEYTTEVEFTGLSNAETWAQLDWSIKSAWTVGSISVTLQLYNYSLSDYPTNGNGYLSYISNVTPNTDETKEQIINVNATHFRNSTGYWKVKAKGVKITDTPFDLKADLVKCVCEYVQTPSHPLGWDTTILFALPVVFGLLLLLTMRDKRKKKTDTFSESFGMTHQKMIGEKMLLEIDPMSNYHKALFDFASETRNSGEPLFIFTSTNSALHSALSGAENVKFFLPTSSISSLREKNEKEVLLPAGDLSIMLNASVEVSKVQREKPINMLFGDLSSIIIRSGFEKTYNFLRFLLEGISSPKVTALFVFNPTAHDPVISSSLRGLFQIQLVYTKNGPKVGTL